MNVFVLCAGRCGSVTLSKACQHITNFTCGHESTRSLHVDKRFEFPENHIEIDNRFAWMLGRLDEIYGDSAIYVYLTRNTSAIAQSYNRRWDTDVSVVKAYTHGILMRDSEGLDDCLDYVKTVDSNIRHFLTDKSKVLEISLESLEHGLRRLWDVVGAEGDIDAALAETHVNHNVSSSYAGIKKLPAGGNHSFTSRKQLVLLNELEKTVSSQIDMFKAVNTGLDEVKTSLLAINQFDLTRKELAEKESELANRSVEADVLKRELRNERVKLRDLESSLKCFVGDAFIRGLGSGRFASLRLPFAMIYSLRGVLGYLKAKRTQEAKRSKKAALSKSDSFPKKERGDEQLLPRSHWPKPNRSRTDLAFCAMGVLNDHGAEDAVDFFEFYKNEEMDHLAGRMLALNLYLDDEAKWLENINAYLGSFGLLPVSLKSKTVSSEFSRIFCPVPDDHKVDSSRKVSVIMPAFNSEETIGHAIESILSQTWKNIELIVVDDCSTDGTWETIRSYSDSDERVVPLKNDVNVGPYVSKNYAVGFATGEYLTGHDADDWAHPQRIENQMRLMLSDTNIKASITRMIRMRSNRGVDHFARIGKTSPDGVARLASISCMFETQSFHERLGYWDCVRFGGDSELIQRAQLVFGEGFVTQETISMVCLDAEGSLTNHPVHGVNKVTGISSSREEYRMAWMDWHKKMSPDATFLNFPQAQRKFSVPESASVSDNSIRKNLEAHYETRNHTA